MLRRYFHEEADGPAYTVDVDTLLKYTVKKEKDDLEEMVRSYDPSQGKVPKDLLDGVHDLVSKDSKYVKQGREYDFDFESYLPISNGLIINRVPRNVLGPNVLGRTWLGSNYIEVLDSLIGDAFQEVIQHEMNHLLYPHENEREIRARTRRQLSNPIYH